MTTVGCLKFLSRKSKNSYIKNTPASSDKKTREDLVQRKYLSKSRLELELRVKPLVGFNTVHLQNVSRQNIPATKSPKPQNVPCPRKVPASKRPNYNMSKVQDVLTTKRPKPHSVPTIRFPKDKTYQASKHSKYKTSHASKHP